MSYSNQSKPIKFWFRHFVGILLSSEYCIRKPKNAFMRIFRDISRIVAQIYCQSAITGVSTYTDVIAKLVWIGLK
ncbi:MAG TPA: hypothetical protein DEF21_07845 [Thalassospira lucentensis]|uniref:Uncharacterized protein n=1 Tax=Thalassospira lucentensis TaxID=168935 RepID=A0A358HS38_9PROT|nr:hypothetical protein [Thalassospira lucentensis]HCW69825.1 hypothetical protein [Thalassospira lucentensis]|tara:strand:- start:167 stop:391 length:225 start_codon:yes stop_codon:yes gene_type:complete